MAHKYIHSLYALALGFLAVQPAAAESFTSLRIHEQESIRARTITGASPGYFAPMQPPRYSGGGYHYSFEERALIAFLSGVGHGIGNRMTDRQVRERIVRDRSYTSKASYAKKCRFRGDWWYKGHMTQKQKKQVEETLEVGICDGVIKLSGEADNIKWSVEPY